MFMERSIICRGFHLHFVANYSLLSRKQKEKNSLILQLKNFPILKSSLVFRKEKSYKPTLTFMSFLQYFILLLQSKKIVDILTNFSPPCQSWSAFMCVCVCVHVLLDINISTINKFLIL